MITPTSWRCRTEFFCRRFVHRFSTKKKWTEWNCYFKRLRFWLDWFGSFDHIYKKHRKKWKTQTWSGSACYFRFGNTLRSQGRNGDECSEVKPFMYTSPQWSILNLFWSKPHVCGSKSDNQHCCCFLERVIQITLHQISSNYHLVLHWKMLKPDYKHLGWILVLCKHFGSKWCPQVPQRIPKVPEAQAEAGRLKLTKSVRTSKLKNIHCWWKKKSHHKTTKL